MRSQAIENYKASLKLSPRQREVLVGVLLGDACLETQNRGRTYRLKVEQSAWHKPYVWHLYQLFRPWVLTEPRQRLAKCRNGTAVESWVFATVSHAAFRFYAQQFYCQGKKQVPKLIHRWLSPRGIAYWFMDDGSKKSNQSKGVLFNTQSFDDLGLERLICVLESQFGLSATRRHERDGLQIYIAGSSYERFVDLVGPFIIPDMRHKLPPARRTQMPKE